MRVVIIASDPSAAQQDALAQLRLGEVIIFPTDTVYGIGGDATDAKMSARVATLKRRLQSKPFPWLVADMAMAKQYAIFSPTLEKIAEEHWPGAVTIVMPRKNGEGSVGLRVPKHPWLRSLIAAFGKPIIGTSANYSGTPPMTRISNKTIKGVDVVFDGGECDAAPSKVIDGTGSEIRTLRK